jgi:hypothetical protein
MQKAPVSPFIGPVMRPVMRPVMHPVMRLVIGLVMGLASLAVLVGSPTLSSRQAQAAPRPRAPAKPGVKTPEQKEAERHFQSGVALFKEAKYTEALAEFERAYEISPQPLVLYNIAGCHRELSQYSEAVAYYGRFLTEGRGKVKPARLTAAQAELDGILARIARVTVSVKPALSDVTLIVDGTPLDKAQMPLILPPGEHRVVVRAAGRQEGERSVRVASGDEIAVDLELAELPPPPTPATTVATTAVEQMSPAPIAPRRRLFAVSAGAGMNLGRVQDGGASSVGLGVALGSRFEVGIDGVFTAYAAIPSVRVRLAGDALAVHLVGAMPISFSNGPMTTTFVAGAGGLGLRWRPASSSLAFRLESLISYAGTTHGTTFPTFLGGELWF